MVSGGGGPGRSPLRGWLHPRRHVRQRDRLLVAVGEATEGGGAFGELAAADDGGVLGAEGGGLAPLGLEGGLDGGDAGAAEAGGEAEGGGAGTGLRESKARAAVAGKFRHLSVRLEGDVDTRLRRVADGQRLALEVEDD